MRWAARYLSFIRFAVVGVLSLVADLGALILFHGTLGIWLPAATAAAYAVAFVVNFGLARIWVFESSGAVGKQLGLYLVLVAVNLAVTVVAVQVLTDAGLRYFISKLLVATVLAVLNYFVSRRWIFTRATAPVPSLEVPS